MVLCHCLGVSWTLNMTCSVCNPSHADDGHQTQNVTIPKTVKVWQAEFWPLVWLAPPGPESIKPTVYSKQSLEQDDKMYK